MSRERAEELWLEAEGLPNSLAKVKLLDEAIREADSANALEAGFGIRETMMEAAAFSGAGEHLLAAFSWCLGKCDELPEEFDDEGILWQYKWAISSAFDFPNISLQQIDEMLDDFQARLAKHGYSPRPANNLRMRRWQQTGDLQRAQEFSRKWQAEPRDDMADCEACELDNAVELLADLGDDKAALEQATPLIDGRLECSEVPHRTLAQLLMSAMRAGDEKLAKQYHIRGYRMVQRDPDFLRPLGMHGIYLARVKDFKKGTSLIETHVRWAMETLESGNRRDFYLGALAILRAMIHSGVSKVALRLPPGHVLHEEDGTYGTHELAQWLDDQVQQICEAYDQRNGNQWHSQVAQQWLELA